MFRIEVNDTSARHGCNHTLTTNSFDSQMQANTTRALHASVKVFIQRTVLAAKTSVAWSSMEEDAVNHCKKSCHLHCLKGHAARDVLLTALDDKMLKKKMSQPSCKHAATIWSFLGGLSADDPRREIVIEGMPEREFWPLGGVKVTHYPYYDDLEVGPAHTKAQPQYYRFRDVNVNIASQLLTSGERVMNVSMFAPELDRQAERYVRRWNRILYHRADCHSDMLSMWEEFDANNLCARMLRSIAPVPPQQRVVLDMYSWSLIGMVYEPKVARAVAPKVKHKSSSTNGKSWKVSASSDDEEGAGGYHYVSVYASVASLLWYVISFLKAGVVGWQQTLMDVVHEVGANVGNLNLYNVGVTDAKQTCCHAAVAVHQSRKGHVFESTSASLHMAAEFVHEHLSVLAELGKRHRFDLRREFALDDSHFPTASATTTLHPSGEVVIGIEPDFCKKRDRNDGPFLPFKEVEGRTVKCHLAFPLRPHNSPSFFPSIRPGECLFGACTDGDFTMWYRHILHIPQRHFLALLEDHVTGAMGLRYCDKHKGTLIRNACKALYAEHVKVRTPPGESRDIQLDSERVHDRLHKLGGLMKHSWTTNFEEITGVIRAHPHPGVAQLFLAMKCYKATAMGLTKMLVAFQKKHNPLNVATGVYGQNTFALMAPANDASGTGKMGVGFTANCLEAGANASLKKALGMQSSLPVLNGVTKNTCRKNAMHQVKVGFSVRQDYTSKNPRACCKRYQQLNEEDTGAFFHAMWVSGQANGCDPDWIAENVLSLNRRKVKTVSWEQTSVFLPTKYGIAMAIAMENYLELEMVDDGARTKVKKPHKIHAFFKGGVASHLRANLVRWKTFMTNPSQYMDPNDYDGMLVVDGRRELANAEFAGLSVQTRLMTNLESYHVYERTLLFYQHAYVHVTANPAVITEEQATASLPESWRSKKVFHTVSGRCIPIDYGCFRCTCRQYAKYSFCEHCIVVGTMQRGGDGVVCLVLANSPRFTRLRSPSRVCHHLRFVVCSNVLYPEKVPGLPFGFPDPLVKGNVDGTGTSRMSSNDKHGQSKKVEKSPLKNNKRASTNVGSAADAKRSATFSGQPMGRNVFKRRS